MNIALEIGLLLNTRPRRDSNAASQIMGTYTWNVVSGGETYCAMLMSLIRYRI